MTVEQARGVAAQRPSVGGLRTGASAAPDQPERFRLSRAGIFNVWQYDEQVFEFADGRLLLRGTNGAGKSKTLEMLLPFVLDGDAGSMDATGRRGSGLVWLMSEGIVSGTSSRLGYLWVEFARTDVDGVRHTLTCGVGLRLGASAKQVAKWYFTTTRRIGSSDLRLSNAAGPLTARALEEEIGDSGRVFQRPVEFRTHVAKVLFGLQADRYEELLRLLYWLRRPQVGEDIDPKKIAEMLGNALPALPEDAIKNVGATFDELTAFGERIARRQDALDALSLLADAYRRYAEGVAAARARGLVESANRHTAAARDHARRVSDLAELVQRLSAERLELAEANRLQQTAAATLHELDRSPGADRRRELDLQQTAARELARRADELARRKATDLRRSVESRKAADEGTSRLHHEQAGAIQQVRELATAGADLKVTTPAVPHSAVWDIDAAMAASADEEGIADIAQGALAPWDLVVQSVARAAQELSEVLAVLDELAAAIAEVDRRAARAEYDERELAAADTKAEQAEGRLADAKKAAEAAEDGYRLEIGRWQADNHRGDVDVDELLTGDWSAEAIESLPNRARDLAAPPERAWADERAERRSAAGSARAEQRRLVAERVAVAARQDPEPPAPPWDRDSRDGIDGLPMWRLVDVLPQVTEEQRAGLEAGLQASGLLDALVMADGRALKSGTRDVILAPGRPAAGGEPRQPVDTQCP